MKIQIDRTPKFFPDQINCVACQKLFPVERFRNLLYSDRSLLQGELCPECAKSNAAIIQAKIKEQAWLLLQNSQLLKSDSIFIGVRVAELLAISQETVKFPSFWQLWRKKLAIWRAESCELQQARFGSINSTECYCDKRQQLERLMEEQET
jgi:hypothetical protein